LCLLAQASRQTFGFAPASSPSPGYVKANLNATVPEQASTSEWCAPLAPCNTTRPGQLRIHSTPVTSTGLTAGAQTSTSTTYRYASITPPAAVDWRSVLTNWPIRNQGSCGEALLLNILKHIEAFGRLCQTHASSTRPQLETCVQGL